MIPPWAILNFKPLRRTSAALINLASSMELHGFSIDTVTEGLARGQVLFCAGLGDCAVAVAWHWTEWSPGVICIEDPSAALTNVAIIDGNGVEVPWPQHVAHLNCLIYLIPWQRAVLERLQELQELPIAA